MFYFNARWRFKLPDSSSDSITCSVIAASAVPRPSLFGRNLSQYRNLLHRYFDPQLYLAGLAKDRCRNPIVNLSTYGWFTPDGVPCYENTHEPTVKAWIEKYRKEMLKLWRGHASTDPPEIQSAVHAAVALQQRLFCDAIILPSPLTKTLYGGYAEEAAWLDAGIQACRELKVTKPIFATVALSDVVLRGDNPLSNPLLHTVADQVTAREIDGVYLVVEQASEEGYFCGDEHTLLAVLLLVDDIVRGARRRVIVNYMGGFGAVAVAAGAEAWTSGYHLGQRRLRLSQFEVEEGRAYPRYYSLQLAGDVGLKADLEMLVRSGYGPRIFTQTAAADPLHAALKAGMPIVPRWRYETSNIDRAFAHYMACSADQATSLAGLRREDRIERTSRWLERATELAAELEEITSSYTDTTHQGAWLRAFQAWRRL